MALGFLLAGMAGPTCGARSENFIWQFRGTSCGWIRNWGRVTHMYLGTLVKADLLFDICLCFLLQTAHIVDLHRDGDLFACSFTKGPKLKTAASGSLRKSCRAHGRSLDSALFSPCKIDRLHSLIACVAVFARRRRAYRAYLHKMNYDGPIIGRR